MLDKLDTPPSSSDQFLWADFIELHALVHPDHCFSRGDLVGIGNRGQDTNVDRGVSDNGETDEPNSKNNTRLERRWRDVIQFAEQRSKEFGDAYPFTVSDDKDSLTYTPDDTNDASENTPDEAKQAAQNLYINLLLASLLRHFPRTQTSSIARYFEEISLELFKWLMPSGSEVRATWASGGQNAPYQGTLYDKMQSVARDIRCTANFQARDFSDQDTGDGGIDIISWHPMADNRPSNPIAFAQCGCSKTDWTFKQLEASPAKHYTHFPVKHPWATYYFMPLDLRDADGGWAKDSDIGQAIIVDRLRLIRLIMQYDLLSQIPDLPQRQRVLLKTEI